jgi:hypothetical protein
MGTCRSAYTYILLASVSLFLSFALLPIAGDAAQQSPLSPTATAEEVAAREQATKLGVKMTAQVARAEDFDWGDARWDLIAWRP